MKLGPEQSVQMPMKTVISLIIMVALGTFGFFQIQEKLNQHATKIEIMEKDLTMNYEFSIKWPRGLLGSLPADSEQFLGGFVKILDKEKLFRIGRKTP